MGIYDLEDMEHMYRCSTSTQKQMDFLYRMFSNLRCHIEKLQQKLENYDCYRKEINDCVRILEGLRCIDGTQTKTINAIIKHIKCTDKSFDERITYLENNKMKTEAEKL